MKAQIVHVNLPENSYPIYCGGGLLSEGGEEFVKSAGDGGAVFISDKTVWPLYGDAIRALFAEHGVESGPPILLEPGEEQKTWQTAGDIACELAARGLRRDGAVIAAGGGVVGDVAGFAAAVYMRGVRLLHIPTTLLAQADSAIGGKTGVNLKQGKNLAGAFHQPQAVLCDVRTLASLPAREYRAGLAEVVKYSLIGDADFFEWLSQNAAKLLAREEDELLYAVVRSAQSKADIVSADVRETSGRRALLNLGHTFAHALEAAAGYGVWLHGEAVAAGLAAAAQLSHEQNGLPASDVERIRALLEALELPTRFPDEAKTDEMCARMGSDKKHTAAQTRFVLLNKIGEAKQQPVDIEAARSVMEALR